MLRNIQMRSVTLAGLFMITAPLCVVADTISNPTINGQVVDCCPVITESTARPSCWPQAVPGGLTQEQNYSDTEHHYASHRSGHAPIRQHLLQ
jgi:hypothetical protein